MKVADRRALPAAAIGYFLLGLWIGVGLYVVGVRPWQFAVLPVVLASLLRVGSIPVAHRLRVPDQKPSRGWTDASRFQATAALLEAVVAGVLILDVVRFSSWSEGWRVSAGVGFLVAAVAPSPSIGPRRFASGG